MKKFFAMAILAIASLSASAEGLYVGGSLGFWHDSNDKDNHGLTTNNLTILPEVGYNLSDKWAVGTVVGYDYTHLCNLGTSVNLFQFNPYVRYTYFRTSNNFLSLFLDGTVGVGAGWASYDDDDEDSKTACTWQIGIKPGVALNFTKNFSFVAHIGLLGYEGANNAAQAAGYSNKGGLMLSGNNLTFGFYYNF